MTQRIQLNKCLLLALILLLASPFIKAQDIPEFNMSNATIVECHGILHDSGGPDGPYATNENTTTVINAGGVITITFFGDFAFEANLDFLSLYDGPSAASSLIGTYTGQSLPPVLTANSGFLTVVLTSDNNVSGSGFSLEWEGLAPAPVPPAIAVNNIPACNASQFNLALSTPVQCAWLNDAVITVNANGQSIPVSSIQQNCAGGQTSTITVVLSQPFSFNCTYTVNLSINIPDFCGEIYAFDLSTSFLFQNCGVNATIISDTPFICPDGCASISAQVTGCFTYTYVWNNGLPATAGPHTVCPDIATTYSVTITEVETSNSVIKTFNLGIENINIITTPQTICQSASNLTLEASGSGVWSGDGINVGSNQFNPDAAGGGLHYLLFTTANCSDSVAISVTPIQTQVVTAACPGSAPFQLQATPAGGTWNGPNTTVGGMFDPNAVGQFLVDYTVNGCSDDLTVNVDDIGGPFTLEDICQSVWFDTISFSPYGGTWTGVGIVTDYLGIYEPSQMPPGNNQFIYNIYGCNQVFNIFVKQIEVDSFHSACPEENPLVLDSNPLPFGGFWSSDNGAILNAATGLFNPAVIPNDTQTFITYQAPNGCIDTMFIFVLQTTVEAETLNYCVDDPIVQLAESVTGAAEPSGGSWSGQGVSGNTTIGYSFSPVAAGVGSFYILYDKNNCQDSIEVNVFPIGLPDTPLLFCSSDIPEILLPSITGGSWSGQGISNAATGLFDPGLADPGSFFVTWTNPAGCNDSVAVTVEALPVVSITGIDAEYCLQDLVVNFSGEPAGGILLGSLSAFTFNPSLLGEGNYEVIYRYTPAICPQTADTVDFVILPALIISALNISDNPICDDQSVTISVVAQGGDAANGYQYSWSNGGPAVASNTSVPGITSDITVTVTDGCSTPVSQTTTVEVFIPFVANTLTSDSLCSGELGFASVELFPPDDGQYIIEWDNVEVDLLEAPAGTSHQLTVTDLNGCDYEETVIIPAYSPVIANFSISPNDACVSFEDMGNIGFIDLSVNGVEGTWDLGNGNVVPYSPGQSFSQSYLGPGNYAITLSIANQGGCTDETSKNLCILPSEPVFIPDIFSPNGDKNNDSLFVRGVGLSKIDFHLYNRWGEEVFTTNDITIGWDGQLRGQPASSGSYFYTFKAILGANDRIEETGEIVLVR